MSKTFYSLLLLIFATVSVNAQTLLDTAAIKRQLEVIYERDQGPRQSGDYNKVGVNDSLNLLEVEAIVAKYGWLGKSIIGPRANFTLWLVIQHADLEIQKKYLPAIEKSVSDSESRPVDLALLKDRVLMREGKKQVYGSQAWRNPKTNEMEIWPIEDNKNVNARRAKLGLSTVEDYAKQLSANYFPSTED